MPSRTRPFLLLACLLVSTTAPAEIYSWTDANGKLQFGDRPPPTGQAETVELSPANRYTHREVELPKIERPPTPKRVKMYSAQWCGVCKQARPYFQTNKMPY